MPEVKKAWENVKGLLEEYERGGEDTTEYILKTLMFAIAYIAENEKMTPTRIAMMQDQVRDEVRIMKNDTPLVYYAAEA